MFTPPAARLLDTAPDNEVVAYFGLDGRTVRLTAPRGGRTTEAGRRELVAGIVGRLGEGLPVELPRFWVLEPAAVQ